jgi:small subunit ribosomal protein S17
MKGPTNMNDLKTKSAKKGKVISIAMDKSVVVEVTRRVKHPVGKYITKHTKIMAHDEDNVCKLNDHVEIVPTRPLSKRKSWAIFKVLATKS